jgi:hypothetical protein
MRLIYTRGNLENQREMSTARLYLYPPLILLFRFISFCVNWKGKKKIPNFMQGSLFIFGGHLVFKFGGGQIARRIEQDMSPMKNTYVY